MKSRMLILSASILLASPVAMAAETVNGMINFEGTVVANTCKLASANGDAATINVNMGTVSADDIGNVNAPKFLSSSSGRANFDVVCNGPGTVSMKFAAKASELSADKKSIRVNNGTPSAGFAQGVGIAIYDGTGAGTQAFDLANGDLLKSHKFNEAGSLNLRFAAAYVAEDPTKIKAGVANASVPFTMTYE
ncbi:fimbrial protein [Burkholderia ubonensis]|uniref:fimbrial protein n=2 Tax=Burkholderia ubonensis TaxID=101571 RepID=UPI00075BE013|nr:fimbrial protein [Burkholderia ubonensis]KVC95583.1 fimbrial protein [Burkholderia ubonensis]KVD61618.1 fimbrial protein [Burkholderia ubonensis]KVG89050.1 fimbrial protein [Burkholderia ubonensis]KVP09025.1 fimbrial protein [Burkholderia ubonensis]KVP37476.1 fimbrial protein [Burkholderia ubonensis]